MRYKGFIYCLFFAYLGLGACGHVNDQNQALIGKWQGKEWLIFGKPSGQDASKVAFEFKPDGTYTAGFGQQGEAGVWRTEKDKLYTKAGGRKEIMVKILQADAATLKFEMNRSGQQETMELTKLQ